MNHIEKNIEDFFQFLKNLLEFFKKGIITLIPIISLVIGIYALYIANKTFESSNSQFEANQESSQEQFEANISQSKELHESLLEYSRALQDTQLMQSRELNDSMLSQIVKLQDVTENQISVTEKMLSQLIIMGRPIISVKSTGVIQDSIIGTQRFIKVLVQFENVGRRKAHDILIFYFTISYKDKNRYMNNPVINIDAIGPSESMNSVVTSCMGNFDTEIVYFSYKIYYYDLLLDSTFIEPHTQVIFKDGESYKHRILTPEERVEIDKILKKTEFIIYKGKN